MTDSIWHRALGMNYGHNFTSSNYDTNVVNTDLNYLWSIGIRRIRVATPVYGGASGTYPTTTGIMAEMQDIVVRALAKGFYVLFGVCGDYAFSGSNPIGMNATDWASDKSYITSTLAPWAQSVGLSELSLGNEDEEKCDTYVHTNVYSGATTTLSTATLQSDIRTLATTVRNNGFTGKISYQSQVENIATWASGGKGGLDYIAFNSYDVTQNFDNINLTIQNDFGKATYISEFGCISNGWSDYYDEKVWYVDVCTRMRSLINRGVQFAYFFCYRDGGFGLTPDTYAMQLTTGATRLAMQAIIGRRQFLV